MVLTWEVKVAEACFHHEYCQIPASKVTLIQVVTDGGNWLKQQTLNRRITKVGRDHEITWSNHPPIPAVPDPILWVLFFAFCLLGSTVLFSEVHKVYKETLKGEFKMKTLMIPLFQQKGRRGRQRK